MSQLLNSDIEGISRYWSRPSDRARPVSVELVPVAVLTEAGLLPPDPPIVVAVSLPPFKIVRTFSSSGGVSESRPP